MAVNEKLYVAVGGKVYKYVLFGEMPTVSMVGGGATVAKAEKKAVVKKAEKKTAKRGGRPKGSKNKPKVEIATAPATTEAPAAPDELVAEPQAA